MAIITENIEVLDEHCRECIDLDIISDNHTILYGDGDKISVINRTAKCSHLDLCRRLYSRNKNKSQNG